MQKSKKVRMPAGIRNKLMAAIAMLLVSSIMMVSSTYAWFTLSTAPEVTGITTSVGANGNLEMALLNGQTYDKTELIASAVGNSTTATGDVTKSNITWGNLVDLSDVSYGLNLIALNPSALNYATTDGTDSNGNATKVDDTSKVDTSVLLKTAVYGADGRVSELNANTMTGVYNSANAKWVGTQTFKVNDTDTSFPAYGVRAIGVDSNMTTAEIILNLAKGKVNSNKTSASSGVSTAVGANSDVFGAIAMSLSGVGTTVTYKATELKALKEVAEGVQTSLNTIVKAYSNAVLAVLATDADVTEDMLTALRDQLIENTSASTLINLMGDADVDYSDRLDDLADAQTEVANILKLFTTDGNGDVTTITTDASGAEVTVDVNTQIVAPLIGGSSTVYGFDADGAEVEDLKADFPSLKSLYVTGGLVSIVAADAGPYHMMDYGAFPIYAGVATTTGEGDDATVSIVQTGYLEAVKTTVTGLSIVPAEGTTTEKTIADFYGYIIDFAFRTNAAGSSLQLQTTPVNRVYSDAEGENLATEGAGSTATFVYDEKMTTGQVTTLLEAVRLVFIEPVAGTIHAKGKLTDVKFNTAAHTATANVKLENQGTAEVASIVELQQNIATKVSVLVYLDGNEVDNTAVANAASSGMLDLNLQFSSSATLVPMQNTALESMVITYTELTDDDYTKAGLYTYNNVIYDVKDGYKIYNGSDGMVYFSNDESTYTKLTAITIGTALEAVSVNFSKLDALNIGDKKELTVTETSVTTYTTDDKGTKTAVNGIIKEVAWTSGSEAVATVADTDTNDNKVEVTAAGEGTAKINAAITLAFTYEGGTEPYTKEVNASYTVTVNPKTYNVIVTQPADASGTISSVPATAAEGDLITLVATPAVGYEFTSWTVKNGEADVNVNADNTFPMPAGDVTVTATFTATTSTP